MPPSRIAVVAALLALYVLWGSTYLAIAWVIETLPLFVTASVRFLVAGALLIGWARARGVPWPTAPQWRAAAIVGTALFLGGNGLVMWAQTRVASGVAALLIAMVPMWIALYEAAGGRRPPLGRLIGLVVGLVGVSLLVGVGGADRVDPIGALALAASAALWAGGSMYLRGAPAPASTVMATGMQMTVGGVALGVVGLAAGELATLDLAGVTARSALSFGWLLVAGSLIGFTVYAWLLRVSTPSVASTYAYVNPAVAVLLGWALHDEPLSPRIVVAGALIVVAVVLITRYRASAPPRQGSSSPVAVPRPSGA